MSVAAKRSATAWSFSGDLPNHSLVCRPAISSALPGGPNQKSSTLSGWSVMAGSENVVGQVVVRAVAERLALGALAVAQPHRGLFLDDEGHRLQPRALVRAVAERLRHRAAARAPPVLTGFEFEFGGIAVIHNGFGHGGLLDKRRHFSRIQCLEILTVFVPIRPAAAVTRQRRADHAFDHPIPAIRAPSRRRSAFRFTPSLPGSCGSGPGRGRRRPGRSRPGWRVGARRPPAPPRGTGLPGRTPRSAWWARPA